MVRATPLGNCPINLTDDEYTQLLLNTVKRIRSQKQRPSFSRIFHSVRGAYTVTEEDVEKHLAIAVKGGHILKVHNKGEYSYSDPGRVHKLKSHTLTIDKNTNLVRLIVKSIRQLNEIGGSTLKAIERFIFHNYQINSLNVDITQHLKGSLKQALDDGYIAQDGRSYTLTNKKPPINMPLGTPAKDRALPEKMDKVGFLKKILDFSVTPDRAIL